MKEAVDLNGNLSDPLKVSQTIGKEIQVIVMWNIAKRAADHGADKAWRSPFEVSSEQAHDSETVPGGKQDDIAIIVSQVRL